MALFFSRAAAVLLLAMAALTPSVAHAFCRTWSCDISKEKCPPDPDNPICSGGDKAKHKALFWPQKCIGFSLNQQASKQFDPTPAKARAKFAQIAELSFDTWQKADCGEGKHPSITFFDFGFINCDRHEFNGYNPDNKDRPTAQGNANLIVVRNNWPASYQNSGNTLALTTLTFNVESGEIYDADIEINGDVDISTDDAGVTNDLQSILTHEIGHFLGIAHSTDETATMYAAYSKGSTSMRDLAPDDIKAVCSIYKPDREGLPSCDPTPRHGYSSQCAVPSPAPSGCSTSPLAAESTNSKLAILSVAGVLALQSRRKKRLNTAR